MNSTILLHKLGSLPHAAGHADVDILFLADSLAVPVNKLVAMLTELEHRDEITVQISSTESGGELRYSGVVRLMRTPPDELAGQGDIAT